MADLLAIGIGSYAVRCALFTPEGEQRAVVRRDLTRTQPSSDWFEQDAAHVWAMLLAALTELSDRFDLAQVGAIGMVSQPSTCLLWDRATGEPLGPALLWNDRRAELFVSALRAAGHALLVQVTTGRPLQSQGSAPKLRWLLDNLPSAGAMLVVGQLAGGPLDSWLLGQLSGGRTYATDRSSAQQTLLLNINTLEWDTELSRLFSIPIEMLPRVVGEASAWGRSRVGALRAPIGAVATEPAAALVGQGAARPGEARISYGEDLAALVFCGDRPLAVGEGLALIGYDSDGQTGYGVGFSVAGVTQALDWCCDRLGIFATVDELIARAGEVPRDDAVVIVPTLHDQLDARHDPGARAAIFGLSGQTDRRAIARAALESMAFQAADALAQLEHAGAGPLTRMIADGPMAQVDLLLQAQADLLGIPVERPTRADPALRGAAYLAARGAGIALSDGFLARSRGQVKVFQPTLDAAGRAQRMALWRAGLERVGRL